MSNLSPSTNVPDVAAIDRIVALPDLVLRNLQVTQCYADLATAFAARTGITGANWCAFAAWASRQAGQSIRGEDLDMTLRRALGSPAVVREIERVAGTLQRLGATLSADRVTQVLQQLLDPAAILQRTSAAVSRGNLKVFDEIARAFARFLDLAPSSADTAVITEFCGQLRAGDPPDGQRFLQQAFTRYFALRRESDARTRAQHLLLANLEIGFHEQTRLQPEIAAALDAPIPDARELSASLLRLLLPLGAGLLWRARLLWHRLTGQPTPLELALRDLVTVTRAELRRVITSHLMMLRIAHTVLSLGDDLNAGFPPLLQHADDAALIAMLQQVDPTPDSLQQSGARDWADFADRMHFIADLFRCYQESPELFDSPFSAEQGTAIREGRIPSGPL